MREGTAETDASSRSRCPTCQAPRRGDATCHRCKTDLTALVRLEQYADDLRIVARRYYANGWYRQAAAVAQRIVAVGASASDFKLLACAHLLRGDFAAARRLYEHLRGDRSTRRRDSRTG